MKHEKPKHNAAYDLPQSKVDEQDEKLRHLVKVGFLDITITEEGGLLFSLTDKGKMFNSINPFGGI